MDNFLEGGLVSIGLISSITITMLGDKKIVFYAFITTFGLIFINLIQAESMLVFPGIISFTLIIVYFVLQFEDILQKIKFKVNEKYAIKEENVVQS